MKALKHTFFVLFFIAIVVVSLLAVLAGAEHETMTTKIIYCIADLIWVGGIVSTTAYLLIFKKEPLALKA